MADKGTPGDGPSLEMPSLPFGRRKGRGTAGEDAGEDHEAAATPPEASTAPSIEPSTQPSTEPSTPPAPEPSAAEPAPVPADRSPAPEPVSTPRPVAVRPPTPTRTPRPVGTTQAVPVHERDSTHDIADGHDQPDPGAARPRRRPQLPGLSGVAAALVAGAVMGGLGVLLVWLASVGCEAARGTASCGDGPGFLVLVAILAVLAYLGGMLLRAFGVPDAGSTSLLAVGVMAVLVLVLFTDALFEWWMALVVPVVAALAYALSWWVTTRVVQNDDEQAPYRL